MANEVDEAFKKLMSHKGVVGALVINGDGIPIKTTLDNSQSIQYAAEIQLIVEKARGMIKNIDTTNDINFIRLRTKKHEVLIAPDKEYALIVIQSAEV